MFIEAYETFSNTFIAITLLTQNKLLTSIHNLTVFVYL